MKANKRKPPEWKLAGYRSGLEYMLHTKHLTGCEYEPRDKFVTYSTEATYKPDFVHPDHPKIYYEAKGYFRNHQEATKYVWMLKSNPDITLRFIIVNPNVRAYGGKKITMGEWLTKYGIEWCTPDNIPKHWEIT